MMWQGGAGLGWHNKGSGKRDQWFSTQEPGSRLTPDGQSSVPIAPFSSIQWGVMGTLHWHDLILSSGILGASYRACAA